MINVINTSRDKRFEVLDGLRGLAAIVVMLYHFTNSAVPLFANATLAVDLFFILSGFVICHSYGDRLRNGFAISTYLVRRVIRLWPMFAIGLLIGLSVIIVPLYFESAGSGIGRWLFSFLLNLFMVPNFGEIPLYHVYWSGGSWSHGYVVGELFPLNPPGWSLLFEMIASLSFVFVFRMRLKVLGYLIATNLICLMVLGYFNFSHLVSDKIGVDLSLGWSVANVIGGLPRVLYGFFLGVLIYRVQFESGLKMSQRIGAYFSRRNWLLYLAVVLVFAFPKSLRGIYSLLVLLAVAPGLVFFGAASDCAGRFGRAFAHVLGSLSYPIYCLHYPIGRAVFHLGSIYSMQYYICVIIAIIATVITSVLTLKYIDEPARGFLTRAVKK